MDTGEVVVAAFSAEQVVRITGLTERQLAYWDKTGFFRPQYAGEDRRSPFSRIYSFADLVGLRTLSVLRNGHNVTMHELKRVAARLSGLSNHPWSEIRFGVWKRKVQWLEPDTGLPAGITDGQYLMVEMFDIIAEMRDEVVRARTRSPDEYGQVTKRRFVVHNQPVVAGTRIPVRSIVRFAAAGYSAEQIVLEYPTLTIGDVEAALTHAA